VSLYVRVFLSVSQWSRFFFRSPLHRQGQQRLFVFFFSIVMCEVRASADALHKLEHTHTHTHTTFASLQRSRNCSPLLTPFFSSLPSLMFHGYLMLLLLLLFAVSVVVAALCWEEEENSPLFCVCVWLFFPQVRLMVRRTNTECKAGKAAVCVGFSAVTAAPLYGSTTATFMGGYGESLRSR
jgi:hypothetical protein